MRPKVVITTLIIAFAVLGSVAFLKSFGRKSDSSSVGGGQNGTAQGVTGSADTNNNTSDSSSSAGHSVNPTVTPEMHAAIIAKEIDDIEALVAQADGSNNPQIITTLVSKLALPDAEVRAAALDALKQLNDTNAIPEMQQAASSVPDAREKVSILDAIDYLRLPNLTDNIPPDELTNSAMIAHHSDPVKAARMARLAAILAAKRAATNGQQDSSTQAQPQ